MTALKLTLLRVQDFKRVEEAEITLDPTASGIVALMGPNESGKTSTLDAFEALVAGRATPKRRKPVRDGAGTATIVGEFTEPDGTVITVTRTYVEGGNTAVKVAQDGIRVAKPAELLDRLYSHIALDPLAFANADSKRQADTLIRLIGFDPEPIDQRIENAYATRTEVNRDVKRLTTELATYPAEDKALAAREPVRVVELAQEVDVITARNTERDRAREARDAWTGRAAAYDEDIEALIEKRDAARLEAARADDTVKYLGDAEDAAPIRQQIENAEATNDAIRAQHDRAWKAKELAEATDRVRNLEGIMSDAEAEKAAAFAEADWPVPGLEIRDGEVYLDGTPFAETSAGRKLRTSTAIAIRLNPELKAIVIRDGSLLDDENRQIIAETAEEHGFTVLMELVNGDAETGVVFSEGRIVDRKGAVS